MSQMARHLVTNGLPPVTVPRSALPPGCRQRGEAASGYRADVPRRHLECPANRPSSIRSLREEGAPGCDSPGWPSLGSPPSPWWGPRPLRPPSPRLRGNTRSRSATARTASPTRTSKSPWTTRRPTVPSETTTRTATTRATPARCSTSPPTPTSSTRPRATGTSGVTSSRRTSGPATRMIRQGPSLA